MKTLPFVLLLLAARTALGLQADLSPVAPLPVCTHRGFTNAIALEDDVARAVIAPGIGRLVSFRLAARPSLLREDAAQDRGVSTDTNNWANYGGAWLWPAAQARWKEAFGSDWPPPRILDDLRWKATAWRRADGSQVCRLRADVGSPCNGRITRDFVLPRNQGRIEILQRIERIGPGDLPLCLWNIAQLADAEEIVLPVEAGTNLTALGFTPLPAGLLTTADAAVTIRVDQGTEHKVGSASARAWIAARRSNQVVLMRASPGPAQGTYPDGGSRVTLYTNKGLGYSEIETLSEETRLLPGQSLTNQVTMQLFDLPEAMTGGELARWLRERTGEVPPVAAPLSPDEAKP